MLLNHSDLHAFQSPYGKALYQLARWVELSAAWPTEGPLCAVAISASSDATATVQPLDESYGIVVSEGLILAVGAMCELRHLHSLESGSRLTEAQLAALRMAHRFQSRRTVSVADLGLPVPAEVHRSKGFALLFLILHELGHVIGGHVADEGGFTEIGAGEGGPDFTQNQTREMEADAFAAMALVNVAEQAEDPGGIRRDFVAGISALFETLDLLEVGTQPDRSHPYAIWRMMRAIEVVLPGTGAEVAARLESGSSGFWYLDVSD